MPVSLIARTIFGATAVWLSGSGLAAEWNAPKPVMLILATALHLIWLASAQTGRRLLAAISWSAGLYYAWHGIGHFPSALLLCAILALAAAGPLPLTERLARWRRATAEIATQLRLMPGLLPWIAACGEQFYRGRPQPAPGNLLQSAAWRFAGAEERLRACIGSSLLPDMLRETVLTAAADIAAQAEAGAAELALDLDQRVLNAAALCRDLLSASPAYPEQERIRLAAECESLLVSLLEEPRPNSPAGLGEPQRNSQ